MGLALYSRQKRRRAAAAFVAASLWPRLLPPESGARFWLKTALWTLALVFGMVALAGPRFGAHYEQVQPRGADLYVLIDVSKSMLAADVPPTRLGRAKADVAALLQRLNGERVALIAFAGKAVVKCPLTTDYAYFRAALDELSPASAPRGGTAVGDAIRKALEVLPQEAERDQTLLLITDGDDQESAPLKAADAAAEKRVAIFTVGLGDAEKGARIPVTKDGATTYMEYKGEQVWSKLDGTLLGEIALKTKGVYIPAGTRAYDLGELYEDHLKGRRAANAKEQRRVLSEQYQLFLALALFCLLLELLIRPYPSAAAAEPSGAPAAGTARSGPVIAAWLVALLLPFGAWGGEAQPEPKAPPPAPPKPPAGSPRAAVSEGLALYAKDDFAAAHGKFSQAADQFRDSRDALETAVAAFDAACAAHRKGDTEKAREAYLEAGLARDKQLAAEAHYNLGCLAAEAARTLAGEKPEELLPDKRGPVVEKLREAAVSYRHCLEMHRAHAGARKNIELVREWLKYYADKWRELDRQRMRRETNLLQFLDYLIGLQRGLREDVKDLKPASPLDNFAESKRAQEELEEEIGPLKEKIGRDLAPRPQQPMQLGAAPPQPAPGVDPKQLEEGIKLLGGWADAAGDKMKGAAERLGARQPAPAADEQKGAIAELQKIWDAVAPFQALLARDVADQTAMARALKPETGEDEAKPDAGKEQKDAQKEEPKEPRKPDAQSQPPALQPALQDEEATELAEEQEATARRTALLKLKAEAELKRVEQLPPAQPAPPQPDPKQPLDDGKQQAPPAQLDPQKIKDGLQKAIDLAPKAVEKMGSAAQSLRNKKPDAAYPDAEEARKILEEIAKAQPKQENQDQKKDEQKKDQQDQQKKDEQKKDEQKKDEQKKEDEKKEQEQQQLSKDQVEAALRKVREREKQKHDRDEELKARLLRAAGGVEKDW